MGFRLAPFVEQDLMRFKEPWLVARNDSFFDQLLFGPNGRSREELMGVNNIDNLISAVTKDYIEYMRHVIDLNFRAGVNSTRDSIVSVAINRSSSEASSASETEIVGISTRKMS